MAPQGEGALRRLEISFRAGGLPAAALADLLISPLDCLAPGALRHAGGFGRFVERDAFAVLVPDFDKLVGAEEVSVVAAGADARAREDFPVWVDVADDHRRHGAGPGCSRVNL